MNRGAQTIGADESLLDAARHMKNLQIGSLPVRDEGGSVIGMISESDLVAELSSERIAHFAEGVYKRD